MSTLLFQGVKAAIPSIVKTGFNAAKQQALPRMQQAAHFSVSAPVCRGNGFDTLMRSIDRVGPSASPGINGRSTTASLGTFVTPFSVKMPLFLDPGHVVRMNVSQIDTHLKELFAEYKKAASSDQCVIEMAYKDFVAKLSDPQLIAIRQKASTDHYAGIIGVVAKQVKGVVLFTREGTIYLDANGAYGAQRYGGGYSDEFFKKLLKETGTTIPSNAVHTQEASLAYEQYAIFFAHVFGGDPVKVLLLNTGSEAVNVALQGLARLACEDRKCTPDKVVYMSATDSFHGRTDRVNPFDLDKISVGSPPDYLNRVVFDPKDPKAFEAKVEELLVKGAGIVVTVEGRQGEGGGYELSKEMVETLNKLAKEKKIRLLVDGVQTGCSEANPSLASKMGFTEASAETFAKTAGGGTMIPVSGIVIKEADSAVAFPNGCAGGTYSSSPQGSQAAIHGMFEAYRKDENGHTALERLGRVGEKLRTDLKGVADAYPKKIIVTGDGGMSFLEFVDPKDGKVVHDFLLHLSDVLKDLGCWDEFKAAVNAGDKPLIFNIEDFKGIIQKMTGENGHIMRLTTSLDPNEAHNELINDTLCYALRLFLGADPAQRAQIESHTHYHVKKQKDAVEQVKSGPGVKD